MPNFTLPHDTAVVRASRSPDPSSGPASQQTGPAAPLTVAPFVPPTLLKAQAAFISTDSRFAAASRLLASLWRADQCDLPAGQHASRLQDGLNRRSRAGWRLRPNAAHAGAAFLSPAIARFVHRALILREPGSLWDETKIRSNLLSSQGLCLNLFVPMALDRDLATAVWRRLLPKFVHTVINLRFESSPGRNEPNWLADGTAFDAVLDVVTPDGELGFIAIELKFIENFVRSAAVPRPRYQAAAHAADLFIDPDAPELYRAGLEQLRREHTLASLMVQRGLAARGRFILIGPWLNPRVAAAARSYIGHLIDPAGTAEERVGFQHMTVETILDALSAAGAADHARALHARYLDLDRVAALALGDQTHNSPTPTPVLCLPAPAAPDIGLGEPAGATTKRALVPTSPRRRRCRVATGVQPTSSKEGQAAQPTKPVATARRSRGPQASTLTKREAC